MVHDEILLNQQTAAGLLVICTDAGGAITYAGVSNEIVLLLVA